MPKKTTIRFYTNTDRYADWKHLHKVTYFEIINWIKSGNYILINDQRIDHKTKSDQIFALLRRKK